MASPCSLCDSRCCSKHLITVTAMDVARISASTGLKPKEFCILAPAKAPNLDNDTVLECFERKGKRDEYLLALISRPCAFLKNSRCSIYAHRPAGCRSYPYAQSKGGLAWYALCPKIPKAAFALRSILPKDQKAWAEIDEYRKLVRRWNMRHGKKKDCLKFLLEECGR